MSATATKTTRTVAIRWSARASCMSWLRRSSKRVSGMLWANIRKRTCVMLRGLSLTGYYGATEDLSSTLTSRPALSLRQVRVELGARIQLWTKITTLLSSPKQYAPSVALLCGMAPRTLGPQWHACSRSLLECSDIAKSLHCAPSAPCAPRSLACVALGHCVPTMRQQR